MAVDGIGNVYINCWGCSEILKVNTSGDLSVFAGNGSPGFSGDGGLCTEAKFYRTTCLAFHGDGDIYIADAGNCRIRKVNSAGIVTTIAGTDQCGYNGDGIPAKYAALNYPNGIAFDSKGNLYITEEWNNRVRIVDTSGVIHTFAGTGGLGGSGDGGLAVNARLNNPCRVAVDRQDNIYIDDLGNHVIRKVDASGVIHLFAGNYHNGLDGDGGPATAASLYNPVDMALDKYGNMYISGRGSNRIRRINSSGIITTVAGNGSGIYSGDGGPAIDAGLNDPIGVAIDSCGIMYIAEFGSNRVRKVVLYQDCGPVPAGNTCRLILPNAFTPGIDKLNNVFAPLYLHSTVTSYSFSVFNRWGQRVFFSDDASKGWEGKISGGAAAGEGVYIYYVTCHMDGQTCTEKGNVTLIK